MMRDLSNAADLATFLLAKEAGLVDLARKGAGTARRAVQGSYDVIGAGTAEAAKKTKELLPGIGGSTLATGIRVAPWVAGAGALEYAAGAPVTSAIGRKYNEEKAKLRLRLLGNRSTWDPRRHMML